MGDREETDKRNKKNSLSISDKENIILQSNNHFSGNVFTNLISRKMRP